MHRISTSNRVSRLFWFGTDEVGIQKNAQHIFLKEAKAVPIVSGFQLRSPVGCGGDSSK